MDYKYLNDPRLARAQRLYAEACLASQTHSSIAAEALAEHGDHGPQISGCVRDHFPEATKDELRGWARRVGDLTLLARAARPAHVRRSTMNRLAREVATHVGAGFYGPQPLR